jgi:acyl-CoA reductase-like NAD-dependent aldehyde dehydrogenase
MNLSRPHETSHPALQTRSIDVPGTAAHFRYFGGACDKIEGDMGGRWFTEHELHQLWSFLLVRMH